MDIKETIQLNKEAEPVRPTGESFIRTMAKDIAVLKKKSPAAPPVGLPVVEPAKKPERLTKPTKPIKAIIPKATLPKPRLKFALIGLGIVIIIGGVGGFLYWWNYLRLIPPVATHYECQDLQCVSIEGEKEDQCQTDEDCQPVEPIVPELLIPVDETRTLELAIGQESLLLDELKLVALEEQSQATFKRILVKLVNEQEKRYADLDTLISSLGISLPEKILSEENYTLFFYGQPEGNRLGIVISTEESLNEETIVNDLGPLLLRDETLTPFSEEFQDNIYQWVVIRYINFPNPDLSIDYAMVGDKLIITTSRESMYAAIDTLMAAPVDTYDWQTYQNEEYGYEVNYPKDWFLELHEDEISPAAYIKPIDLQILENGQPIQENILSLIENNVFVLISIIDTYQDKTIEEIAGIFRGDYQGVIKENIILANREAIKMTWQRTGETSGIPNETGISIFLENPNGDRLLIQTESTSMQDYQDTFNQILATFKFIE